MHSNCINEAKKKGPQANQGMEHVIIACIVNSVYGNLTDQMKHDVCK